ncbi:MAG TPA: alpha/beta hydrolase [Candidatus Accumulibacter phosphatis]|nr:MAG: 3-oxoadipate enol-lactonase 2 [Candidatus Accumulibacter sp. SK-11]HAY26246.1 alpha/beta hydrolase [Accumulibacter sp.]HCV13159.1 alpha/beta hydrolase [Accumulibacter sp.]HRL77368.1 alpha/beta hydrolase [Candidatus Accumulibacter phosphatis]HRQ95413.1 alpha/beta hydrolase [Candidatus Accumulibacter phosphatis]
MPGDEDSGCGDGLAGEAFATVNGVEICYQSLGDPGAPAILLIMGLGMQLVAWPDAFCNGLVGQGFRVLRFDNRDTGRSTRIVWRQRPRLLLAIARGLLRLPVRAPYLLADMADDAAGLLSALQVPRAHVVGVSLGGMVAQCLAARHPQQVLSLTSIMSASGNWRVSLGKPAALRQLLSRPASPDCERSQVDHLLRVFSVIGSPGFPSDAAELRRQVERGVRRAHYPRGQVHQLLAIIAAGDRRRELAKIRAPTLVVHGADDPLLPVSAGRDTAHHIPGARLQIIAGMGHDLAPGVQALLLDAIVAHCRSATVCP